MKRSHPSSPSCHDNDELLETKRSRRSYYPPRYHYEYEFSEDENSIVVECPESTTILDLVSTVRINFKINYILRSSGGGVDKMLDSIQRCFYMRLYVITGFTDYHQRLYSTEFCQLRGNEEYDVNQPEGFFTQFLTNLGIPEDDVIEKLIGDTKDFVNRKRARDSSPNRVLPIAISLKVYTLQQEDKTIENAKWRAITTDLKQVGRANRLIKLLERPPPYKFMIEFDDHRGMLGDCCICLSKLSVGDEVLILSCSHPYHYKCLIPWVEKGKQCPLCRGPTNLRKFIESARFRAMNLIHGYIQMDEYLNPEESFESLVERLKQLRMDENRDSEYLNPEESLQSLLGRLKIS